MMGIFNIVKMSVLLKVIHIFTAIPISFLTAFYLFIYLFIYSTIGKAYSQNHLELQRVLNNKKKLKKTNTFGKLILLPFKTLQSYSNQNSVILAYFRIYKPVD